MLLRTHTREKHANRSYGEKIHQPIDLLRKETICFIYFNYKTYIRYFGEIFKLF